MDDSNIIETETDFHEETNPYPSLRGTNSADVPNAQGSLLLPAILLLLVGGFIGFLIGRQSVTQTVVETAASTNTINSAGAGTGNTTPDNNGNAPINSAQARPTPVIINQDATRGIGDPNAPVTIVEFSDYQCPFCLRHFQETMPQLKADYIDTGRVYYVFKDYPIVNLHPVAPRIHEAARCVGEIGGRERYWQAHDAFFGNGQQLTDLPQPDLDNMLIQLTNGFGMDEESIRECLESGRYIEAVNADLAEGQKLGIDGTPGFFVNGYPVPGAQPFSVFQQVIALAEEDRLADAYQSQPPQNNSPPQAGQPVTVPVGDDPVKGSPDAPITIVEYSDFQCPFCLRHFQETLPQLQQLIDSGQIRYIFKDFPIHSIHPQAQKAHESGRCARELAGDAGFWMMHDLLFARQNEWAGSPNHVAVFKGYASEIKLSQTEFDACLDSGRYADAVNEQVAEGARLGVSGTPSFFINGQLLVGAQPFSVFQQAVETLMFLEES